MRSIVRYLLITLSSGAVFLPATQAMFESEIFTYDDKKNAKGLHVFLEGRNWQAKEVIEEDIPFHQKLFSDPEVMAGFADGQVRIPTATAQRLQNMWIPRFQNGRPHGGLTVFTLQDQEKIGHVVAGGGDEAGVSEIAYSYMPNYWGRGVGSEVVGAMVHQWGPEVRRIGMGKNLDEVQDKNIIEAFQCFDGKVLERFDATASPSNPRSWKILEKFQFQAAASKVQDTDPLDFEQKEIQSPQDLEKELLKIYDIVDSSYTVGTRYKLIDHEGKQRTFSKHNRFDRIKFHFEYYLK